MSKNFEVNGEGKLLPVICNFIIHLLFTNVGLVLTVCYIRPL